MTDNPFRLFYSLGYHDLLPIIPPDAELSPDSNVTAKGKVPGSRNANGQWVGRSYKKTSTHESDLDAWHAWGAGVGIRGSETLLFVDVDHHDRDAAQRLHALIVEHLGPGALRFGRKPGFVMAFRTTEHVKTRMFKFGTPAANGKKPGIDFISDNLFVVAHGVHAGTGKPYTWNPAPPAYDTLPEITPEQVRKLIAAVDEEFGIVTGKETEQPKEPIDPETLRAPDMETLRKTLAAVPNSQQMFPTRESYISMLQAIKGAAGPENDAEAMELWLDWCERWDDPDRANDIDIAESDWHKAHDSRQIGFNFIQKHAVNLYFQPVQPNDTDDMFAANAAATNEAKPQRRLELLTDLDLQTRPDPKWLIERHIPEDGFGILYGEPGAGKSFVALDMALHIAVCAAAWHGDPIRSPDRGAVLYIAGEGAGDFKLRVQAWKKRNFMPDAYIPNDRFRAILEPLNFRSQEDIAALIQAIKQANMPRLALVVIDTVARATPGADENDSGEMGLFVRACDEVKALTGAFVLGVHHPNKSGGLRGSTALIGAADAIFKFERKKGQFYGRLVCEKMKAGTDDARDAYRLDVVDLGGELSSLVPVRVEDKEADQAICTEDMQDGILKALAEAWARGEPWSLAPQARGRYAPAIIARRWEVPAAVASQWLAVWMDGPVRLVGVGERDKKSKMRGLYRVGEEDNLSDAEDEFLDIMS